MDFNELLKEEVAGYERNVWEGELGGKQVKLYAKPLSPKDVSNILKYDKEFTSRPSPEGFVRAIILKATDEDGKRVFNHDSLPLLRQFEVAKIGDIFAELFGGQFEESDLEEIEGNSETTEQD